MTLRVGYTPSRLRTTSSKKGGKSKLTGFKLESAHRMMLERTPTVLLESMVSLVDADLQKKNFSEEERKMIRTKMGKNAMSIVKGGSITDVTLRALPARGISSDKRKEAAIIIFEWQRATRAMALAKF